MVGVDISKTFVRIANENAQRAGLDIAFEEGDAVDLPLPSDGFDFAVCTAAFKNFTRRSMHSTKRIACSSQRRRADHRSAQFDAIAFELWLRKPE